MTTTASSFEPVASFVAAEVSGFGGKPAPAQPQHPEL
jgi:hypothetical protein